VLFLNNKNVPPKQLVFSFSAKLDKMKLEEATKAIAGQQDEEQFVAEALEAVKLKFGKFYSINCKKTIKSTILVSSLDDIECSAGYAPEFAHQHFGETYFY
jgi:hypothetical protein